VGKQAAGVFSQFAEISKTQIVVERPGQRDEMTFKIELKSEDCDKDALSEEIARKFQSLCLLRPDRIEFVAAGSIGEGAKAVVDLRNWGQG
jgi:phenylacetate-coenzyme A ligase PaaK-like adenylate-forming protein